MDLHQGLTSHLATKRSAEDNSLLPFSAEFVFLLVEESGDLASLGQQWLDGADMIKRGKSLSGWFVGRAQRKRANELIKRGTEVQERAAARYKKLVTQEQAEDETDTRAKE